jgi:exosome complex RNA-binding protein Csl4
MEIELSQLQIGDEFLYAVQGNIVRAKVIRPVQPRKIQPSYNPLGFTYHKAVKCKIAMKEVTYNYTWNGTTRTQVKKEYCASEDYTVEKFVNLNHRNLWLIKKGKQ